MPTSAKPIRRRKSAPAVETVTVHFNTDVESEPWTFRSARAGRAAESTFRGSEAELVGKACVVAGYQADELVREGALYLAKRLISRSLSDDTPKRLEDAFRLLVAERTNALKKGQRPRKISATTIRLRANEMHPQEPAISFRTADRWLRLKQASLPDQSP